MVPVYRRLVLSGLAIFLGLVCIAAPAWGQSSPGFTTLPPQYAPPPATTGSVTSTPYPPAMGYQAPPNPYYPPGYGYGPNYGRVGGALTGAANVYNAQGQYQMDYQQSQLTRQQVNQAKIDTQRKMFDEWQYEQANTPTLEDNRERIRQQNVRRSRNDPPATEIWNAKALNDLFDAITQGQTQYGLQGPMIPLSPSLVHHINVTDGTSAGSVGLLRDGGTLEWPYALQQGAFDKDRKHVDQLAQKAWQEAGAGRVSYDTINAMTKAVNGMIAELDDQVAKITPSDYTRSRRYLRELTETVQTLKSPDVSKYVSGNWKAKGNNVGELIYNMASQGLRFAPAVAGDESAYTSLHKALVAFDSGMGNVVARGHSGSSKSR